MNELKNNNGYVVFMKVYQDADKAARDEEIEEVWYGGTRKTTIGDKGFIPYKSEQSANRGRKAWEAWCENANRVIDRIKYQVEDVIPLNEKMFKEIEKQDFEIKKRISRTLSSMLPLKSYD